MRKFISLLLTLLILSGCWNKQELNEIAISLALGIDKLEDSKPIPLALPVIKTT